MYFFTDEKLKTVFGWSAKCGCEHIKRIFWYLYNDIIDNLIHKSIEYSDLPNDIENYTVIIVIRNPYERLVSGFLNKYKKNGQFRHKWLSEEIIFSDFVDNLLKKKWNLIDMHHFTPQTSEKFDHDKLLKSKELKVYDITPFYISNADYL